MSKIYREFEVQIPDEAKISYSDQRVYIITKKVYISERQYNEDHRMVIGHYIKPGAMHPNENFKTKYPAQWEELTNKKALPGHKKIGLYAAVSSIVEQHGIYDRLKDILGEPKANALLDYTMFMIGAHSDATEQYSAFMADMANFSHEVHSDSWYSKFFNKDISIQQIMTFKNAWAAICKEMGVESVYLCIDGSNNDCAACGVELAEKGKAKSGKTDQNIISYMYAVSEETGIPVTYAEYRGGEVDAKAIQEVITYLKSFNFHVTGVTLDRAFCAQSVLDYLEENNVDYVVKLKGKVVATRHMMTKHAQDLKWNVRHAIPGTNYFGLTDQGPIFESSTHNSYLHLYFDWKNGGERAMALMNGVQKSCEQANANISQGKKPSIPTKYEDFILIFSPKEADKLPEARVDYEKLQQAVDLKGYTALASSACLTAAEANKKYSLRNNSEVCYKFIKGHLGFDVTRVHSESSIRAKFFECFLGSIVRYFILLGARSAAISTNVALRELSLLEMHLLPGDIYTMIHTENGRQLALLKALNVGPDRFDAIADVENRHNHGDVPRRRKRKPGPKRGTHRHSRDEHGNEIKLKPGPKPGSHHKKIALKKDGTPKMKPGPKVGSHHKKSPK